MSFPPAPAFLPIANPGAVITAKNVRFTVLTDRLIRLEYSKNGRFEDRPSQAFWYREQPVPAFKKTVTDSSIEIETDFLHLKYQITTRGFTGKTLSVTLNRLAPHGRMACGKSIISKARLARSTWLVEK